MFFKNADEVDEYICGVFRDAGEHPEVGPKVRAQTSSCSSSLPSPTAS